jgi:hypothetical protein
MKINSDERREQGTKWKWCPKLETIEDCDAAAVFQLFRRLRLVYSEFCAVWAGREVALESGTQSIYYTKSLRNGTVRALDASAAE